MSKLYYELCSAIANNKINEIKIVLGKLEQETNKRNITAFQKKLDGAFLTHLADSNLSNIEQNLIIADLNRLGYQISTSSNPEKSNPKKRGATVDLEENHQAKKPRVERNKELSSSKGVHPNPKSQQFIFASSSTTSNTVDTPQPTAGATFIEKLKEKIEQKQSIRQFIFYTLNHVRDIDHVAKKLLPLLVNLHSETRLSFLKRFMEKTHAVITKDSQESRPAFNSYPFTASYVKLITLNQQRKLLTEQQRTALFSAHGYEAFVAIGDLYELTTFMTIDDFYQTMMRMNTELILFTLKEYKVEPTHIAEIFRQDPHYIVRSMELRRGITTPSPAMNPALESPKVPVPKTLPLQAGITNVHVTNYFFAPPVPSYPCAGIYFNQNNVQQAPLYSSQTDRYSNYSQPGWVLTPPPANSIAREILQEHTSSSTANQPEQRLEELPSQSPTFFKASTPERKESKTQENEPNRIKIQNLLNVSNVEPQELMIPSNNNLFK